jgi:methionyl-tRNA synthetase
VVENLETAKLRGLESQGMLLAASDEERVIFLTPEKPVQPGSKIS